jgi:myo-inositol 2-dehydrogenase/D-chiro-inositol 1-dehydrogenase
MIGAGFISAYHIQGLLDAGAQIAAIYSQPGESAARRAAEYGIAAATDDLNAVLGDDTIDAVVVATPDYLHMEHAIRALEAGKPVFLQKPMARNTAECRAIIAAQQPGVPVFVSFMHRYFEEIETLRQVLAEGALGDVYFVRQRNATPGADWASWFYSKEKVGGGVMLQLGTHGIDLLRYVFGEIRRVRATTTQVIKERTLADGTVVTPDSEDLVIATYMFENGLHASHECAYAEVAGTDRFRMEVYGTRGTAWLRTERGRLALYAPEYTGIDGWYAPDITTERVGYRQHRHFLDMLRGAAPPDQSAYDGLMSVAVVEAIYRADESAGWEEVTSA